ncbi:MAG: c-type cytochrome [Rhodocyclaceae bacterium]|nr:c-type cytochrome [Rhodocyclaceae bacterium]
MTRLAITFTTLALAAAAAAAPVRAQDMEKGKEISAVCAGCHGDNGQGGKKGVYPRLAGQPATYLATQLRAFRARQRINIPMYPYTQDRELPDEDIRDVSAYLASIRLETAMPEFKGDEDALTRLQMVDKVMIVPRVEGDIAHGGEVYADQCAFCHGKTARGGGRFPMLAGQYTNYLQKQINSYLKGERPHDDDESRGVLAELKDTDIRDILAYLTSIQ